MAIKTLSVPASIPQPARNLNSVLRILFKLSPAQSDGLIEQGHVRVNGRMLRHGWRVCEVGDEVAVDIVPQAIIAPTKSVKRNQPKRVIDFLYDDADLMVINKPANLLTVPTKHREPHTVLSLVERRIAAQQENAKAFCVHRLDRGVSGVLVVAKSLEIAEELRNQFAERKPKRKYIAIVSGVPKESEGRLVNYLSTDDDLNRVLVPSESQGELAITNYAVAEAWTDSALLHVRLETGRRNQIRVQLAEIGHPILGDPRYKPRQAEHWGWPHTRIALHAESLGFVHPRTGESVYIESQWPQEFRDFVRQQRKTKSS
ncbi:MAG: RluA family pseudouridine synthase [Pirellula sp.]|jgi:23S rRNA pseudouridine1911/1915/1917 synthase|nr:RluA family pseudouridine synthase [Pirellula sp.]